MRRIRRGLAWSVVLLVPVVALVGQAQSRPAASPGEPGRDAPPPQFQEAPDGAPRDSFVQVARGLLARRAYAAPPGEHHTVAWWDFLVGPGMSTERVALTGGAVLEVAAGRGRLAVDRQEREFEVGATLAVDEGRTLRIVNGSEDRPMVIRVVLVRGPGEDDGPVLRGIP